jgi:phospholipase/carboxylesterase
MQKLKGELPVTQLLSCVEINPSEKPKASIIWMHGLGADGHDFENIVPQLQLPQNLSTRFVFPHAPTRPVTINSGYVMRAWYDITAIDPKTEQDEKGIAESQQAISALIEHEVSLGIPTEHIVLAGFSQGGAMALHAGLRYPQKLAGILALSCYLPLHAKVEAEKNTANLSTSIMLTHGTMDPVVPFAFGELSKQRLESLGYKVEWHSYPMQHNLCLEEIQDIGAWLQKVLDHPKSSS